MNTLAYEAIKYEGSSEIGVSDHLLCEEALQILVNDEVFTMTMRTPGDDLVLAWGLLFTEGIIKADQLQEKDIRICPKKEDSILMQVAVDIDSTLKTGDYLNGRSLLSVSSCGICGRRELDNSFKSEAHLNTKEQVEVAVIHNSFNYMKNVQSAFERSGGSHAAAAFDLDGKPLAMKEDIGRHNAVDKVIGELLKNQALKQAKILLVSGRISYEIIVKTFKAKIPILCAVSAPSSLAVDFAKELGITLLAFCREGRASCYAHPERLSNKN